MSRTHNKNWRSRSPFEYCMPEASNMPEAINMNGFKQIGGQPSAQVNAICATNQTTSNTDKKAATPLLYCMCHSSLNCPDGLTVNGKLGSH